MNSMDISTYQKILDWCIVRYGKSQYFDDYPDLEIEMEDFCGYSGEYDSDNNLIIMYDCFIQGIADTHEVAMQTMIHEYQHYLQDPELCDACFRDVPYSKNHFEIAAENIAQRDWKACYYDLFGRQFYASVYR